MNRGPEKMTQENRVYDGPGYFTIVTYSIKKVIDDDISFKKKLTSIL